MTLLEFCVEVVISCVLSLFLYLALDYRVVSLVLKGGLVPSFRLVVAILRARAPPPPSPVGPGVIAIIRWSISEVKEGQLVCKSTLLGNCNQ